MLTSSIQKLERDAEAYEGNIRREIEKQFEQRLQEREKLIFEIRETGDKERWETILKEEKTNREMLEIRSNLIEITWKFDTLSYEH